MSDDQQKGDRSARSDSQQKQTKINTKFEKPTETHKQRYHTHTQTEHKEEDTYTHTGTDTHAHKEEGTYTHTGTDISVGDLQSGDLHSCIPNQSSVSTLDLFVSATASTTNVTNILFAIILTSKHSAVSGLHNLASNELQMENIDFTPSTWTCHV